MYQPGRGAAGLRALRSGPARACLALFTLLVVAMMALAAPPALAQAPTGSSEPAGRGPADQREVEASLDGFFARQLEGHEIPGATVSVVRDGEVLLSKGYGQADVEAEKPVVADETLFRIASTSKLFTATAVMQQVEEGKLDLDEDVNAYLEDVEIPHSYPGPSPFATSSPTRPVRADLHRIWGAERRRRGAARGVPLGNVPARVRPPGEATSYSNYGMSLAGHLVEEASGMPFGRYVEKNIAGPLGMESTRGSWTPWRRDVPTWRSSTSACRRASKTRT